MKNCQNCAECQGERISSKCITWEGKESYDSFEELISDIFKKIEESKVTIDGKTVSESDKVSDILQSLIDRETKKIYKENKETSKAADESSSATCNLNISSLDNCSTCDKSFCDKLQFLVTEIVKLKAEVTQLKSLV
ncbi:MAG: hypothetical protein ACRC5G_02720 [Cetobacterium sp.]